jgi:hypothetical protein
MRGLERSINSDVGGDLPYDHVGASLLAKNDNDNACFLHKSGAYGFFASKLAPTWHWGKLPSTLDLKCPLKP